VKVVVNGRFHAHRPTGMQRYALAVCARLGQRVQCVKPAVALRGAAGHLWEQAVLPASVGGRLLWSPNNTGPLAVRHHVCTIHDLIPLEHPEWFHPRFAALYRWLMPRLARRLEHVVAVSTFTAQRVQELLGIPAGRITVAPNGVDEAFHPRDEASVAGMRERLGLGSFPYFLYVGSLEPRKNLRRLMEAWRLALPALDDDIQLVVTGATGRAKVFSSCVLGEIPPRVRFTDYVAEPDLPTLYSGALGAVYPSLYEGFGLPVLEAMACGTPAIASHGSSLPEVGGDAALYVDPTEPEDIASAMRRVAGDQGLRTRMRAAGLRQASRFSWDRCTRETWQVLEAHV
jgi:glycosyltransferase involved in cell wall biosynthesis